MRAFDWDPIRAEHYGQRLHRRTKQAGHMTAPDQCCSKIPQRSTSCRTEVCYPFRRKHDAASPFAFGRTKTRTGRRTMRAIGLVLLSIAIMALLLTDADAKRRSSAQGSQAAGASRSWCATYPSQGLNPNCSYSSFDQCWATVLGRGGFCKPNPFPGSAYGTGYTWGSGPMR